MIRSTVDRMGGRAETPAAIVSASMARGPRMSPPSAYMITGTTTARTMALSGPTMATVFHRFHPRCTHLTPGGRGGGSEGDGFACTARQRVTCRRRLTSTPPDRHCSHAMGAANAPAAQAGQHEQHDGNEDPEPCPDADPDPCPPMVGDTTDRAWPTGRGGPPPSAPRRSAPPGHPPRCRARTGPPSR